MQLRITLLALAASMAAQPVLACETEPDLFILPDETQQQASDRTEKTHTDQWVVRWYHQETYVLEHAPVIYIGKVVSATKGDFSSDKITWPSSKVEPLVSIKGNIPSSPRTLISKDTGGSCDYIGDGSGAYALVGQLVFIFEGLPKSQSYPNGIQSFGANQARLFELLDPLATYLQENESKPK